MGDETGNAAEEWFGAIMSNSGRLIRPGKAWVCARLYAHTRFATPLNDVVTIFFVWGGCIRCVGEVNDDFLCCSDATAGAN